MKPTVGRIIHTRWSGELVAAIINQVSPDADDTLECPAKIKGVTILTPSARIGLDDAPCQALDDVMLYDTEAEMRAAGVTEGFFWPERQP